MRAVVRFMALVVLVVACLIGFVLVGYQLRWPWAYALLGGSQAIAAGGPLGRGITNDLLALSLVCLAALMLVWFTSYRRVERRERRRAEHPANGWFGTMRIMPGSIDHGRMVARKHGHERSPHWPRVAHEHLLREPACVACGHRGKGLQVHHIKPFHLHPQLELDPDNLITLCEIKSREHHLLLGHLGEWGSYNEHVRHDAKHFYSKNAVHIRSDLTWQKKMSLRP